MSRHIILMLPKRKNALDILKSRLTGVFSTGKVVFNRFNALRGMIIALPFSDVTSFLRYRTRRWPSVETKTVFFSPRLMYTPVIAGRSSSLLVAKIVLLMARASTSEEISAYKSFDTEGTRGKSVAFSPDSLYRPLSEMISIL